MFKMVSSPHTHSGKLTARIMLWVILAMMPALFTQIYYFGYGVLIQSMLAIVVALIAEFVAIKLRARAPLAYLADFTAVLTGLILAMAIPPYAPYWIIIIGTLCALLLGKQVYGGLGQNPFNPAMIGYVILLISFPLQMTTWMPPLDLLPKPPSFADAISLIFSGLTTDGFTLSQLAHSIDGITQATPLDSAKIFYKSHTELNDFYQLVKMPIFMGNGTDFAQGWWQVNLAFLVGGLFLVLKRTIHWQIPVAMLFTFFCLASTTALAGGTHLSAVSQMFSGAMMFGAFFIATDPVTASITPRGKIVFGALVGLFVYLIRYHGNFPDGVAFAVLLSNICVPLIDHYTRPRVAGYQTKGIK